MNKRQAKKQLKKRYGVSAQECTPRQVKILIDMIRRKMSEQFYEEFLYGIRQQGSGE